MSKKKYEIEKIKNEIITLKSKIQSTKIYIPFIKGSLSVSKILMKCYEEDDYGKRDLSKKLDGSGTGFFLKVKDPNEDNRYKYFLMTNEHVLQKEIINDKHINFTIKYFFEQYSKTFDFDRGERFVKEYKTNYDLDVTIVEIKPNEIPIILFLEPDYELNQNNCRTILNQELIIHQYPQGLEQCVSEGPIEGIVKDKIIKYKPSTQGGSSGSPLLLKNKMGVIGIHFGGIEEYDMNCGNFIYDIIKDIQNIKEVDYIYEEEKNRDKYVYTSLKPEILRFHNGRKFKKNNYEIVLKKINERVLSLTVTNNDTKITFSDYLLYKNLDEKLEEFDHYIYIFEFDEINDSLSIKVRDKTFYKLNKREEDNNQNYIVAKIEIKEQINRNKNVQIINSFEEVNRLMRNNQNYLTETGLLFNPNKSYAEVIELIKKYENENEIKDNCEIVIDYKKVPFSYTWNFSSVGTHFIKYNFKKAITKSNCLFYNCKYLTEINLSNFDMENVTNMENMFDGCSWLKKVDLTNVNTRNALYMYGMFGCCESLKGINFFYFNTEKVKDMKRMFFNCYSLLELDLSFFNTENVKTTRSMFSGCSKIKNIDLSNMRAKYLDDISYMFRGCSNLVGLDIVNLKADKITEKENVFAACSSIIADNVKTNDKDIKYALSNCQIF